MIFNRIFFAVPRRAGDLRCQYAERCVRELRAAGADARLLITEPERSISAPESESTDMPVHSLAHGPHDGPSDLWLSLVRFLEENAPCAYVSNGDWTAALACPRLSNRIAVIGVLHEDTREDYDHCARLGRYWNALVVLEPALRQRIIGEYPAIAARLGPMTANSSPADYIPLLSRISADVTSGRYRRRQHRMPNAPQTLFPSMSDRELAREASRVNAVPLWPETARPQAAAVRTTSSAQRVEDHRIILAVPTGRVSGVDVFSVNLARELICRGYKAELVQTAPDAAVSDRLPMPEDVPVGHLQMRPFPTWRERWDAMRRYLEERAPCIYLPNYDSRHSCVAPTLSAGVKIVGIGHSDDAQHYAHLLHLAPYWDAVVGVSDAVTSTIATLAPGIEGRQWTIPYGIPIPESLPRRPSLDGRRLNAVYTGRIVRFQKRALDLLSIATALQQRACDVELTVAGTGTELMEFLGGASQLILSRHLRYVGALANDDVMRLLADSDVFVLPSSFEGLPVSLLEAMAHGCVPVVSSIRSGVPQVIEDGRNGYLLPIGDINGFADRMQHLSSNPEVLESMRSSAYKTVRERHGVDRMTSAYLEVFEKIVSNPYVRPSGRVAPPPGLSGIEAAMPRFPMPVRRVVWRLRGKKH